MKRIHFPAFRRVSLGILIFLTGSLTCLWFLPYFQVREVQINGASHLGEDEIMFLLQEPIGKPLLKMYTESLQQKLIQHPWVLEAQIDIVFPNKVVLHLIEREVLAYLPYYGAFLAVSADGTSLELVNKLPSEALLYTGMDLPFLALGEKIPNPDFLRNMEILVGKMAASVRLMISEMRFGQDGFFYLMTSDNYQIRVTDHISEQQLLDMRAIVLFMREQGVVGSVILQEGLPVFLPRKDR